MKFVFSQPLRFSFRNLEPKRKAQKDFVSYTKPSQLMQISLELESG